MRSRQLCSSRPRAASPRGAVGGREREGKYKAAVRTGHHPWEKAAGLRAHPHPHGPVPASGLRASSAGDPHLGLCGSGWEPCSSSGHLHSHRPAALGRWPCCYLQGQSKRGSVRGLLYSHLYEHRPVGLEPFCRSPCAQYLVLNQDRTHGSKSPCKTHRGHGYTIPSRPQRAELWLRQVTAGLQLTSYHASIISSHH